MKNKNIVNKNYENIYDEEIEVSRGENVWAFNKDEWKKSYSEALNLVITRDPFFGDQFSNFWRFNFSIFGDFLAISLNLLKFCIKP